MSVCGCAGVWACVCAFVWDGVINNLADFFKRTIQTLKPGCVCVCFYSLYERPCTIETKNHCENSEREMKEDDKLRVAERRRKYEKGSEADR